jgi:hypothetical protein
MKPNPQPPAAKVTPPPVPPAREMKGPSSNIDDLLKSVGVETKRVSTTPKKAGGSTGKNSVTIKL